MIKSISVNLTGPLCNCKEQNLTCSISPSQGLDIECQTCKVSANVPYSKLTADYNLDKPYPKDEVPEGDLVVRKEDQE